MVLSLCAALGLHWAALQSVAWVGMLFSYSQSESVVSAIEKTFDGRHPCPLCNAIHKAEQTGKKRPEMQFSKKIDMDCVRGFAMTLPRVSEFSWLVKGEAGTAIPHEPVAPPPRAA
jgi:hypothetical protein